MNRLTYPQKFALISLLFALPLTLVLVLLISESRQQISAAQQEQRGVQYLRSLRALLEQVPQAGADFQAGGNRGAFRNAGCARPRAWEGPWNNRPLQPAT